MAGQSNMSGRGVLSELPTFQYSYKVKNYANDGNWKDAVEPIDIATNQVDSVSADTSPAVGAGPAMAFGNALAPLLPYREIGLIPCAKSATDIASWQKSGLSRTTLYGSMVARAIEAQAAGPVKGLIFYQGESDADDATAAANWATSCLAMITDLRADIAVPDLKVIVTKLHIDPGNAGPHWATVQTQQDTLHGALDGDVALVDASDLVGKVGDAVHLSTASQVTLGQRYAAAMAALLG